MEKQFASRGGLKLQVAIDEFKIDVNNLVVLDVGSSTGGFVDCLLQSGAKKVYSVDTAYGELAWKLRKDERVIVMERTNILHLEDLPEQVDLITIDASWTKLELILPVVKNFLRCHPREDGDPKISQIIALLKPHYQADKRLLVKGVLPEEEAIKVKDRVIQNILELGFKVEAEIKSPILGGGGNTEYLLLLSF